MDKKLPLEIRWHGRGGQGVVTASRILASTALKGGYYLQSLPEFGAERSGAPIAAYTRISATPIIDRGPIDTPDAIIVLDSSLLETIDVLAGMSPTGAIVVNAPSTESSSLKHLKLGPKQELWTVNASQIAMDTLGRNIPNTPILGAFAEAAPVLDLATLGAGLEELLSETFSEKIVKANLEALRLGNQQVQQVQVTSNV